MKRMAIASAAAALVTAGVMSNAHATLITIDSRELAAGTNVTNLVPGVRLSKLVQPNIAEYAPVAHDLFADGLCSGLCGSAFGSYDASGTFDPGTFIGNTGHEWPLCETGAIPSECMEVGSAIEILFDTPTDYFEALLSRSSNDDASAYLYDSSNQLLAHCFTGNCLSSGNLNGFENTTLRYRSADANISRVIIGGLGAWAFLHAFSYEARSVPEPSSLALLLAGLCGAGLMRRKGKHRNVSLLDAGNSQP